jgi:hypothetical protein
VAAWVPGYLLSIVPPAVFGLFPVRLMLIGIAVGLVELILGTHLGARIYQEDPAPGSPAGSA